MTERQSQEEILYPADCLLQPVQKGRGRNAIHLGVVKLEGDRQSSAEPFLPVFAPEEKGVVIASGVDVYIRVTMGMGAFIHSSKASAREVLLGSTSLIRSSIPAPLAAVSVSYHSIALGCRQLFPMLQSQRKWGTEV